MSVHPANQPRGVRMPADLMKEIVIHAEYLQTTVNELLRWEAMLLPPGMEEGVATSLSRHVSDILRIGNQTLERDKTL